MYFYRSASAYCHEINLERCGHVEAKPINSANKHWDSPLVILDAALERERQLGQSAARLLDLSLSQGDHATHDFLERFVADQGEADARVQTVRDRLKLVRDVPAGLFMFDRDVA